MGLLWSLAVEALVFFRSQTYLARVHSLPGPSQTSRAKAFLFFLSLLFFLGHHLSVVIIPCVCRSFSKDSPFFVCPVVFFPLLLCLNLSVAPRHKNNNNNFQLTFEYKIIYRFFNASTLIEKKKKNHIS